ncbi:MAG: RNA 3'-terminal phosphate cyclase [Candidatus Zhuqueibacterota bacterium]
MIHIDGSFGEGGGQILRTSLSLSLLTGRSFEIKNIRANRKRSGLMAQHLSSVEAARLIGKGTVRGASLNSTHLVFEPGAVQPGSYSIDIPTAGATTLVLQTIYLPLAYGRSESRVTIAGGTHVPWSPCFHYLKYQWLPAMEKIGLKMNLEMDRAGFFPEGQGAIRASIFPVDKIRGLELTERRGPVRVIGISAVANLNRNVAERQKQQALKRLKSAGFDAEIEIESMPSKFKNTMCLIQPRFEQCSGCFTALGAIGKRAEKVADESVAVALEYLRGNGCVDKYLADQLILPLCFGSGKSTFTTPQITEHLRTNIAIIKKFLEIEIRLENDGDQNTRIIIQK